jgi:alginate O-acetyltransferase complex protein AlgI
MTVHMLGILSIVLLLWLLAWNLPGLKTRQTLLLLASYFFYSNWGLGFLAVLIASSLLNFSIGSLLRRRPTVGYLWLGVITNVLLLGFFKYLPPVLSTGATGSWHDFASHIIMPVGMSFWTFQGLSYLFDTYREEEIDPSLLEFALYMAFWPTVFSGPVCRMPDMLPQFREEPVFSSTNISVGALRVIQGLFMKFVLAQLLAPGVAAGYDQLKGGWGGLDVWLLGIGFGFLLFFDFAGYSLMVIGVARLFGIQLAENFDRPFLSNTPSKFWTRWHMSLSFWIRDYLFIPLAAARRNSWWPYATFVFSMTLFGLWHSAKWTFIFWGIYHGLLLVGHRLCQHVKRRFQIIAPHYLGAFLSWATTFLLVSLGWIFFRANNLSEAFSMLSSVFSPRSYSHLAMPASFYILTTAMAISYFITAAARSLVVSLRTSYRDAVSGGAPSVASTRPKSLALTTGGVIDFFALRWWWWFAPTVFILTVFGGLAMYNESAVISVRPFIYTLF